MLFYRLDQSQIIQPSINLDNLIHAIDLEIFKRLAILIEYEV